MLRPKLVLVTTALVSLASLLQGCLLGLSCSKVACHSGASITVGFDAMHDALVGGRLRVCRNEVCSDSEIIEDSGLRPGNGTAGLPLEGVFFHNYADNVVRGLELRAEVPTRTELHDGDVYTLELRDNVGAVVVSQRWEAKYHRMYPNGEDCDGDYWCRQVELE